MKDYAGNMKKYMENMKKYREISEKCEEISGNHEKIRGKYEKICVKSPKSILLNGIVITLSGKFYTWVRIDAFRSSKIQFHYPNYSFDRDPIKRGLLYLMCLMLLDDRISVRPKRIVGWIRVQRGEDLWMDCGGNALKGFVEGEFKLETDVSV